MLIEYRAQNSRSYVASAISWRKATHHPPAGIDWTRTVRCATTSSPQNQHGVFQHHRHASFWLRRPRQCLPRELEADSRQQWTFLTSRPAADTSAIGSLVLSSKVYSPASVYKRNNVVLPADSSGPVMTTQRVHEGIHRHVVASAESGVISEGRRL